MLRDELKAAHNHSQHHREEIERSGTCACFFCGKTFKPDQIKRWVRKEDTALCPFCGIDAVIGSASGIELDYVFLKLMCDHFFDGHGEVTPLRPIKEWLYDFYDMTDGNSIREIMSKVWEIEVESVEEANRRFNAGLDLTIKWLEGFRRKV